MTYVFILFLRSFIVRSFASRRIFGQLKAHNNRLRCFVLIYFWTRSRPEALQRSSRAQLNVELVSSWWCQAASLRRPCASSAENLPWELLQPSERLNCFNVHMNLAWPWRASEATSESRLSFQCVLKMSRQTCSSLAAWNKSVMTKDKLLKASGNI